jgi:hypothetical protein
MYEASDGPGKYSVHVKFRPEGFELVWGPIFLGWPFLLDRLLALIPYLSKFYIEQRPSGIMQLTLGDMPDGSDQQLCFSGFDTNHLLVPDGIFLQTDAYEAFKNTVDQSGPAWDERADQLYWRGSLTGQAETFDEIFELPRIKLALLANTNPLINAKITDLSQFGPLLPELEIMCRERNIIGRRTLEADNLGYRYLIDIDGNTNSWPGLYTKLASGSPVIKLRSQYRQWYYDKLIHGENIWFIDNLNNGLMSALQILRSDPRKAKRIAIAGRALANQLTVNSEYNVFRVAALDALSR